MKKFVSILVAVVLTVSMCACSFVTLKEKDPEPTESYEEVMRTEDISDGIYGEESFSGEYDMDFDGEEEEIVIETIHDSYDEWNDEFYVTIGNYSTNVESIDGGIFKVYACDIDTYDDKRDLAVITIEQSGDVRLRIYKYEEGLPLYEFRLYDYWEESYNTYDSNWIGYPTSYYFNVNDDDTITIQEQTSSNGMWSLYKKYELNDDGQFEFIAEEKYEILPDFMENNTDYYEENMSEDEYTMWRQGYIKAYRSFYGNGIYVEEGEYFKVIYDDNDNNIFIETESGESGWVSVDYENNMESVNMYYFYLAG